VGWFKRIAERRRRSKSLRGIPAGAPDTEKVSQDTTAPSFDPPTLALFDDAVPLVDLPQNDIDKQAFPLDEDPDTTHLDPDTSWEGDESLDIEILEFEDLEDLEQSSRTELSARTLPPERRLMKFATEALDRQDQLRRFGGIDSIEFIGILPDRTWAWTGEAGTWGSIEPQSESLNGFVPQPGDIVRARIDGWPWKYHISSIAVGTLRRNGERVNKLHSEIELRREGRLGDLQVGDLIVALVPFSPHASVGADGSTKKGRPAIFMGWQGDAAVVRGIYTATKDRYMTRRRAIRLEPEPALEKRDIAVRDRNVEIPSNWVGRRIGSISETNRGRIGIGGQPSGQGSQPHSVDIQGLPTELVQYVRSLLDGPTPRNWTDITVRILRDIQSGRLLAHDFRDRGVLLSDVGQILRVVGETFPGLGPRPLGLRMQIDDSLSSDPTLTEVALAKSHHAVPVDILIHASAVRPSAGASRDRTEATDRIRTEFIPSWSEPPSLVLFDQTWSYGHLGERRIDLALLRSSLVGTSPTPCYIIGPCMDVLIGFHRAAKNLGWEVRCAETRQEQIEATRSIARQYSGQLVVVTNAADLVADLEESGFDLHLVDSLQPFVI